MTTLKKTIISNIILDRLYPLLIDAIINQFFISSDSGLVNTNCFSIAVAVTCSIHHLPFVVVI